MKMIFGKRQFVLATLVFVLSGAIYLNWRFSNSGRDFTSVNSNYGDSQLVNSNNNTTKNDKDKKETNSNKDEKNKEEKKDDKNEQTQNSNGTNKYFSDTKIERNKNRDKSVETIQSSLNNKNLTNEEKIKLTQDLSTLVNQTEAENKIESLIKAKGFSECVAFLDKDKANIVVKSEGLTQEQAAQIKDIVLREGNVKAENIRIVEVK